MECCSRRSCRQTKSITSAMQGGTASSVRQACAEFLTVASGFYTVRPPGIRVLAARPLRVREGCSATELFGDYNPENRAHPPLDADRHPGNKSPHSARSSALPATKFCHHLDTARNGRRRGASAGDPAGRTSVAGTKRAGGSVHGSGIGGRSRGRTRERTIHGKARGNTAAGLMQFGVLSIRATGHKGHRPGQG